MKQEGKVIVRLFVLCFCAVSIIACDDVHPDDHNSEENARGIHLVRKFQRVKTYNCDAELVSDKVTTVSSPTKSITIRPRSYKNLVSSNFKNQNTGSTSGSIWSYDTITLDMANAWLTMQVREGINAISYSFKNCDHPMEQDVSCNSYQEEVGVFYIDVEYEERYLDGFTERRPSEQTCLEQDEER